MPILERKGQGDEPELRSVSTPEDLVAAREEGFVPSGGSVNLTDPNGNPVDVAWGDVDQMLSRGYGLEGFASEEGRATEAYNEREYGSGFLNKAQTFGEHALDTATLGGYSALLPEEEQRRFAIQEDVNEGTALLGDITGGVASLAAGGAGAAGKGAGAVTKALSYTPGALVTRGATAAGAKFAAARGGGALARLGGAAIEGGIEGAGAGFGQANRELALLEGPVTAEKAAAIYGTNILGGVALGGGLGVFGKAATMGMEKSGRALAEFAERAKAGPGADAAVPEGTFADNLAAYAGNKESLSDAYATAGKQRVVTSSNKAYERALENRAGLNRDPSRIREALETEAQQMRDSIAKTEDFLAGVAKEEQAVAKKIDKLIQERPDGTEVVSLNGKAAKKYREWHNAANPENRIRETKEALEVAAGDAAKFREAIQNGEVASTRRASMGRLPERLAANEALQKMIPDVASGGRSYLGDVASRGANQIANMGITGAATTLGGIVAGPVGAAIGAVAGAPIANRVVGFVNDLAAGRLSKASAEVTKRVSTALNAFATGASKAERPVRVGALQALQETSFGKAQDTELADKKPSKRALVQAYRARERELLEKTEPGPDGTPQVRPEVRQEMYNYLRPLQAHNPVLADQIETVMSRAMSFLASKLSKRPEMPGVVNVGKDNWTPSDWEMASWARYLRAVRNPVETVERLNAGQVTAEDGEAFRAVYPEWFNEIKSELIGMLPEMKKKGLSYSQKFSLFAFTGVPTDPCFYPPVMRVLQSQHAEPGTEDGTAPKAQPQFGSVNSKAFEPTPAQSRAG